VLNTLKGAGSIDKTASGKVLSWDDKYLSNPGPLKDRIVYCRGNTPLYRIAFLVEHSVRAVLLEKGGKNYHPLIFLKDARIPAIAGLGQADIDGKTVTVESGSGVLYTGKKLSSRAAETADKKVKSPKSKAHVYANVGYNSAMKAAAETGADGIGLARTEFTLARTLSRVLDKKISGKGMTVKEFINGNNEADAVYAIARNRSLRDDLKHDLKDLINTALQYFGTRKVIFRTPDIARDEDDPMGNRGIRRCVAEGGHTLEMVALSVKEALQEHSGEDCNIGIILPLVSHYSQIRYALEKMMDSGLTLKSRDKRGKYGILFGWEIEMPGAAVNNEIWLESYKNEFGVRPDYIGIGTNDLTQFTVALGRDVSGRESDSTTREYLRSLYDESDFAVIKQISGVAAQCRKYGTRVFLLGEAAANPDIARLMLSMRVTPSVSIESVQKVRHVAAGLEKNGSGVEVFRNYVDTICKKHYPGCSDSVRKRLLEAFKPHMK